MDPQNLSIIFDWLNSIANTIGLLPNFSIEPIAGDASSRKYYLLLPDQNKHDTNQQFIIMQTPNDSGMKNFINIANYLSKLNISINVPKIFAINNSKPTAYLLLSYLGDQLLFKNLNISTAENIYKTAWQALANIQTNFKNTIKLPLMNKNYIKKNLLLFKTWYLETHLKLTNIANIDFILAKLENYFTNIFTAQSQVFVHVDYHSRNLILDINNTNDPSLSILDFQDAMHGPISYDIGSLLQDAYLVWPEYLVEKILLEYFNHLININNSLLNFCNNNFKDFLKFFYLTTLQRHVKNLGIFARLKYLYKKPSYLQHIPNLLNYIHNTCNKFPDPELLMLKNLLSQMEPVSCKP